MEDYGLKISGQLIVRAEIPSIYFYIDLDDEHVALIQIDGFSGIIIINGHFFDQRYSTPEQLRQVIQTQLEKTVEQLTAQKHHRGARDKSFFVSTEYLQS